MGLITKDADSGEQAEVTDPSVPEGHTVVEDDENYDNKGTQPLLLDGTRVKIVKGEYKGRMAVIIGTTFKNADESSRFHNAFGDDRMAAQVESYTVRTRDSRNETFSVKPSEVSKLDVVDGWGRGEV